MRASYARTHAHRTKNFGTAAHQPAAEGSRRQIAQEQRKILSSPAGLCKIPINVLVHSTTAMETCQERCSRLFMPKKAVRVFFAYLFYFYAPLRQNRRFVRRIVFPALSPKMLIIITYFVYNRGFAPHSQPFLHVLHYTFTVIKYFARFNRQKTPSRAVHVFFAFCTNFDTIFLHVCKMHNQDELPAHFAPPHLYFL